MPDELPSNWKKAQVASAITASVLIPLLIAIVGYSVNQSIKDNELSLSYIELSVDILKENPKPGTEKLREWAIDVVNNYSDVKLSKDAQDELTKGALPLENSRASNPLSDRAWEIEKNKAFDAVARIGQIGLESAFRVNNHVLLTGGGSPVPIALTPHIGGKLKERRLIVIHSNEVTSNQAAIRSQAGIDGPKVSVHIDIERNGSVTQSVPFDFASWHAGRGQWKELSGLNNYSISITLMNNGELQYRNGSWQTWVGKKINEKDVLVYVDEISGEKTGWHRYTETQLDSARKVISALLKEYPSIEEIVGHSDISENKPDPGPAFPIGEFKQLLDEE